MTWEIQNSRSPCYESLVVLNLCYKEENSVSLKRNDLRKYTDWFLYFRSINWHYISFSTEPSCITHKEVFSFNSRTKIEHDIQLNIELDSLDWDWKNPISFRYHCTELLLTNKGYWCPEVRGVRRISNVSGILLRLINLDIRDLNRLYVTTDRVVMK